MAANNDPFIPGLVIHPDASEHRYIHVIGTKVFIDDRPAEDGWDHHFLGMHGSVAVWGIDVPHGQDPAYGAETDLYSLFGRVSETDWAVAGRAVQIVEWARTHRFCGRCGEKTHLADNERAFVCPSCRLMNFPRLSPAIITLVTRNGGEEALARLDKLRHANGSTPTSQLRGLMQKTMQNDCAVFRTTEVLAEGVKLIQGAAASLQDVRVSDSSLVWNSDLIEALELENLDFNELEATLDEIEMALAQQVPELAQLAKHREIGQCASCHQKIDPLGFALENYDAIGAWRDDVGGAAVDNAGRLPGVGEFAGDVVEGEDDGGEPEGEAVVFALHELFVLAHLHAEAAEDGAPDGGADRRGHREGPNRHHRVVRVRARPLPLRRCRSAGVAGTHRGGRPGQLPRRQGRR